MANGAFRSPSQEFVIDPTPSAPEVLPLVRPVGIEGDRATIRQCAKRIEMLTEGCNAVETWIAIGGEFAALKTTLAKNSKHDKSRLGWCQAFEKGENKFGLERRMAENYIAIHAAFFHRGNALPQRQLPQSRNALLVLARLLIREENALNVEPLQEWIRDGLVKPTTTEDEIKALAKVAGLLSTDKTTESRDTIEMSAAEPAVTLKSVLRDFARLPKNERKLFLEKVGRRGAPVISARPPFCELVAELREIEAMLTNVSAVNVEDARTRVQEILATLDPRPALPGRSPHWCDRMNKAASRH